MLSANTNDSITLDSYRKAILHIDCDAFFASVEQSLNPELKGKPVVTGKERGIAASMSYEAKARGVTRGMRLFEIKKVCPECVILPSDYETYSLISKRMFSIIRRFTPDVEEYGIDEAYADITGLRRMHHGSYEDIALKIQDTLERELGFTVSVGLSLSKSLAKICSKYKKPAGFTRVRGFELHEFLKNMPTHKVCGFGPNSVELLAKHGVLTVLDFIKQPELWAKQIMGKVGVELWRELRGEAVYPILKETKQQASLSKTKTFTPASCEAEFVKAQLLRNLESACIKLRRHGLRARTMGVFLKDNEFFSSGTSVELTRATASTMEIAPIAGILFAKIFKRDTLYRQTGVWFSDIEADKETQLDFFDEPCRVKAMKSVSECIDRINDLYGKHAVHLAYTAHLNKFTQHLGERGDLTKRKTQFLKGETHRQHIHIPMWNVSLAAGK